jgi:hypothetical protein
VPSTASVSTFSESDFPSPNELPPTPEEFPCSEPFINGNLDLAFDQVTLPETFSLGLSPAMPMSNEGPFNFNIDIFDTPCTTAFQEQIITPQASPMAHSYSHGMVTAVPVTQSQLHPPQFSAPVQNPATVRTADPASDFPANLQSSWPSPGTQQISAFHHLSPHMQYLIEYYDKAICPTLVAVDGPKNPYRAFIIPLAAQSGPALSTAIAALAANVLHVRSSAQYGMAPPAQIVCEEAVQFKTTSVNIFNAAIQDPAAAQDDSVLATLVVLALYNISNSGLSKLKSQMSGIRRILALRGSNTTQFLQWATMFFTWLDIMTATFHDHEAQIRTSTLDLLDFSANLGALEHLASCESRLLKMVSGQQRQQPQQMFSPPFSAASAPEAHSPFSAYFTAPSPPQPTPTKDFFHTSDLSVEGPSASNPRHDFWSEMQHIRPRIRHYTGSAPSSASDPFAPSTPMTPSFSHQSHTSTTAPTDSQALSHASEVMRHAALLFAERLAFPHLPPNAPQIQHLVASTLHHLSSIAPNSPINRFLLWALMVVGAECVRPMDRDVVRLRCGEAMREPGFFQRSSALDVLERVWAADERQWDANAGMGWEGKGPEKPRLSALGGQSGRWRRAMDFLSVEVTFMV